MVNVCRARDVGHGVGQDRRAAAAAEQTDGGWQHLVQGGSGCAVVHASANRTLCVAPVVSIWPLLGLFLRVFSQSSKVIFAWH